MRNQIVNSDTESDQETEVANWPGLNEVVAMTPEEEEDLIQRVLEEKLDFATIPIQVHREIFYTTHTEKLLALAEEQDDDDEAAPYIESYNRFFDEHHDVFETIQANKDQYALWQCLSDCQNALSGHCKKIHEKRGWRKVGTAVVRKKAPFYEPETVLKKFYGERLWNEVKTMSQFMQAAPELFNDKKGDKVATELEKEDDDVVDLAQDLKKTNVSKVVKDTPAVMPPAVKTSSTSKAPVVKTPVAKSKTSTKKKVKQTKELQKSAETDVVAGKAPIKKKVKQPKEIKNAANKEVVVDTHLVAVKTEEKPGEEIVFTKAVKVNPGSSPSLAQSRERRKAPEAGFYKDKI